MSQPFRRRRPYFNINHLSVIYDVNLLLWSLYEREYQRESDGI